MKITVVDTGVANIASVASWIKKENLEISICRSSDEIESANAVILPGVGTFAAGIKSLESNNLTETLKNRVENNKPTLGICLGMQMFCNSSQESPGINGLNIVPQTLVRFPSDVAVPHFGWNTVESSIDGIPTADAYFANSFCLTNAPSGWQVCWTDYGFRFVSLLKKEKILLTQFHPELSADYGSQIFKQWIKDALC